MTIELVTGTPGAGKTCYVVARRIAQETGRKIEADDGQGGTVTVERRIIVAGIRGLAVEHERLPHTLTGERVGAADIAKWNATDPDGEPVHKRLPGQPAQDVEASLFNWWLWCKPGDLIVCDEVQYIVPRGTLGKDPPHYIKALEVHRHYGVDFIFITQDPALLDTTLRRLVGLHRHVRAIYGGLAGLRMVYEWDHASNPERYTSAVKASYRTRPADFKLYKSTQAVVAPPKSGRSFLWVVPLLFTLTAAAAWTGTARFRAAPVSVASADTAVARVAPAASSSGIGTRYPKGERWFHPVYGPVPNPLGCYTQGDSCTCLDQRAKPIRVTVEACRQSVAGFDGLIRWEPRDPPPDSKAYGAAARPSSAPST